MKWWDGTEIRTKILFFHVVNTQRGGKMPRKMNTIIKTSTNYKRKSSQNLMFFYPPTSNKQKCREKRPSITWIFSNAR
jgi:hypothetical protein